MARCDYCGSEVDLPFICNYCKGTYCSNHRLPEAHECSMMFAVKMRRPVYDASFPTASQPHIRGITSMVEVSHLLVAWLVLSLCFSLRYVFSTPSILPLMFIISSGTVGTGFIFHELMHKFSAQRYGFWSEFRLWPRGLIMTIAFSLITAGNFVFAAPGATYFIPRSTTGWPSTVSRRQNGLISLAGPLTNVVLAAAFFAISGSRGLLGLFAMMGFQVNLWLAAFNMIPLGGMDGQKVLSWDIKVWATVTIPLWLTVAFQMLA
jgi:Zn-dependent protease